MISVVTMLLVLSMAFSSCVVPPASETTEGTSEQTTEQTTQTSEMAKQETTETETESSAETTETITESSEEGTTESATESSIDTTETVTESSEGTSEDITESDTEPSTETTEKATDSEPTETTVEANHETTETDTESETYTETETEINTDTGSETKYDPETDTEPCYTISIEGMEPVITAPGGEYVLKAPEKDGYVFIGWVAAGGEPFASQGVIGNNVSISPVFEKLTDTGLKFSSDERIYMTEILAGYPTTVGFTLKINEELPLGEWYGVLLSNSIRWGYHLQYQINELRQPSVNFGYVYENETGLRYFSAKAYHFDQITLPIGEEFDLYFVIDRDNGKIHCYFNGELAQTLDKNSAVSKHKVDTKYFISDEMYNKTPFVIGGNTTGSNYLHFRGEMLSMSIWSDARTDAEIATGGVGSPETNDPNLLAKYKFYNTVNSQLMVDLSGKGHDLESERLWLSTSEVSKPTDYDYCFAVVGDTQSLSHKNPSAVLSLYDWIANNSAANKHNIKYVLGLGDITENAQVWEWELAKLCFSKLNGKMIPYMMAIGNHDKYDFKNDQDNYIPANRQDFLYNQYLTSNEYYMNNLTGYYGEGDVTSAYTIVTLGSTKWLIMTLDFGPTDDMLEWASDVIGAEENQDCKVIITTHAYLYRDGTTIDVENDDCYAPSKYNSAFNDGDGIFDKLINKHSNIVLVLSGHDPHDHIVCEQMEREDGSVVTQMLIDPQYMDNFYGATGMVALLYYKEDTNQLTVRYYSTVKGMYGSELSQFTVYLD